MKKIFSVALLAALVAPLMASAATSSDVAGKWVHVRYPSLRMEVVPNNAGFVVSLLRDSATNKYIGQMRNGVLVVSIGPMESKGDIDTKTGNLIFNGQEYRHLKAGESFDYKRPALPKGY